MIKRLTKCALWIALWITLVKPNVSAGEKKSVVHVVVYDKIRGYLNWMQDWFIEASAKKCSTQCLLSDKIEDAPQADVVVFHAPTHGQKNQANLPTRHPHNLMFVMLSMEQPKYAKVLSSKSYIESSFDLLATYSREKFYPGTTVPNMPITYFPLNILSPRAVLQPARPFADKMGKGSGVFVALFTSNCHAAGATSRFEYLEQLMGYIKVHSYGKCLNNIEEPAFENDPRWPPIAQRRARKVKLLSHYKFYLAFENLQVDDYVSEKVYEGLFAGALPVYRGASSIAHFMPSNDSFIDANNMSPRALANLLTRLGNNEAEYNKYFEFKQRLLPMNFIEVALRSYTHPNVLCRLCSYAVAIRDLPSSALMATTLTQASSNETFDESF